MSKSPTFASVMPFAIVIGAGLAAWFGTWDGLFLFDDIDAIEKNAPLQAGDWWNAAFGPHHQPLANRPLSCLSLVIDASLFGAGPTGPHVTNLLLHLCNAMLVLSVVRGCLLAPSLAARFSPGRATWLAAAIAAVWVAHPLGGDAVCYATQRSTLLFSGLLLLALHAVLRAHGNPARRLVHQGVAVSALALAMASKEDAVVGPLLVVLFERAFVFDSWRALARRAGFFAAVAATWGVLAVCVSLGAHNQTVGWSTNIPVSAWQWLSTQAGVIVTYLRLLVWPSPLRGAYDRDIVRAVADAVMPGLVVLGLLGVSIACWRRRPWWGWLGATFFLLLAPTSSVVPIVTEIAAERRMYLPMLLGIVPAVVGVDAWRAAAPGRTRIAVAAVAAVIVALGFVSRGRVAVYRDPGAFWADAWEKRDPAARSFLAGLVALNYGDVAWRQRRTAEAYACYDTAMTCDSPSATAIGRHAMSLLDRKRPADAVASLRRIASTAHDASTLGMLGIALHLQSQTERGGAADPRLVEADELLARSLAMDAGNAQFWGVLAEVRRARGLRQEADAAAARARELGAKAPRTR